MEPIDTSASSSPVLLIIDDTVANLGVIASHLEDKGFEIVIAQSGEDGIKRAQRMLPDLILLDVMMPGIDGFETCRRLKASPITADIPVIFMTALSDTTDKVSGFEAGGVDYVTKPIQVAEVLIRINTHLGLRAARRQLAERNAALQQEIEIRHKAEAALLTTNQHLASTIDTLERTQTQRVLAAKIAGLGALVAGIAHELNTPIGVAMLTASTLDADMQKMQKMQAMRKAQTLSMNDTIQMEGVDTVFQNVSAELDLLGRSLNRAGELIRRFRLVAVDQLEYRIQLFELYELVRQSVHAFQEQNPGKSHRIEIEIDKSIAIKGYPDALDQVMANLLSNAFRHAFVGETIGTIKIEAVALDDEWVRLIVSDDGKGISPEQITKIFDPFYTTQLGKGGSGFGLYAVYNQVNFLMGGRINAESTLGQGTRFILDLPRVANQAEANPH